MHELIFTSIIYWSFNGFQSQDELGIGNPLGLWHGFRCGFWPTAFEKARPVVVVLRIWVFFMTLSSAMHRPHSECHKLSYQGFLCDVPIDHTLKPPPDQVHPTCTANRMSAVRWCASARVRRATLSERLQSPLRGWSRHAAA